MTSMSALRLRSLAALALASAAVVSPASGQQVEWAQRAGGPGGEEGGDLDSGTAITTDSRGDVYAAGLFSGVATFGTGKAARTLEASELVYDDFDAFVVKYAPSGALLWARSSGGGGESWHSGIGTDSSGNVYVTGGFQYDATFGAGEATETTLETVDDTSVFVAKYNRNGAFRWVKSAGGIDDDAGYGIVVDGSGNSYVTGVFSRTATFGAGEARETVLEAVARDCFVAKFSPTGALLWAKQVGGAGDDAASGIARDRQAISWSSALSRVVLPLGRTSLRRRTPGTSSSRSSQQPGRSFGPRAPTAIPLRSMLGATLSPTRIATST
jgi:hypothetical protein